MAGGGVGWGGKIIPELKIQQIYDADATKNCRYSHFTVPVKNYGMLWIKKVGYKRKTN